MNWKNFSLFMTGLTVSVVLWACRVRISETKSIAESATESRVICVWGEDTKDVFQNSDIPAKPGLNSRLKAFGATKVSDLALADARICVIASK